MSVVSCSKACYRPWLQSPQWLLRDDVFGGGEAARGCDLTRRDDDGINKDNHDSVNQ